MNYKNENVTDEEMVKQWSMVLVTNEINDEVKELFKRFYDNQPEPLSTVFLTGIDDIDKIDEIVDYMNKYTHTIFQIVTDETVKQISKIHDFVVVYKNSKENKKMCMISSTKKR